MNTCSIGSDLDTGLSTFEASLQFTVGSVQVLNCNLIFSELSVVLLLKSS